MTYLRGFLPKQGCLISPPYIDVHRDTLWLKNAGHACVAGTAAARRAMTWTWEELEMLLEAYFVQTDGITNKLNAVGVCPDYSSYNGFPSAPATPPSVFVTLQSRCPGPFRSAEPRRSNGQSGMFGSDVIRRGSTNSPQIWA